MSGDLGIVAIGRNEGARLERCLESIRSSGAPVAYADSGSSDGSAARARSLGASVVELDPAHSFSAARGRNEGFARLVAENPSLAFVQFVDADCEIRPGWLEAARAHLVAHPDVAVVCGRRRERFPEASPYNRLTDLEWDTPIGDALACGGDALMRVAAFRAAGGFSDDMIAGEEPELCLRIRRAGGRVERLDCEMTLHDAAMTRFGQWWRRQVRSGHAYAELLWRQGLSAELFWIRRVISIAAWGIALPLAILLGPAITGWPLGWLALAYPWLWARIYRARRELAADRALYASACVLGKFADAQGLITFVWRRLRGERRIIEYR